MSIKSLFDYIFNRNVWEPISEERVKVENWDHNFPDNLLGYSDGILIKYKVTNRVTGSVKFKYKTHRL